MKTYIRITILLLLSGTLSGALLAQEEDFLYDAKGKRDPFVPLVSGGGAGYISDADTISGINDIRLEGIVWEEGDSIAIINGEIFKEGQEIGSVRILKIDKDSVVFDVDGEAVRLELLNND